MGKFDIIAGIPSFNNEKTISFVTRQIDAGLQRYHKKKRCLIINMDGGSTDDTTKKFLETNTITKKRVLISPPGTTGKGTVLKLFFKESKILEAKYNIINDSDLRSINPSWVKLQIDAIEKYKYDYATPIYNRYKYDGSITKHICYPLIYGVFCKDIRQPIGGDFAFSRNAVDHWLKCKWSKNVNFFGIDIFMSANAILGKLKICQLLLGSKIHNVKDPAKTLSPMFRQVTDTLFTIITNNYEKLRELKKVKETKIIGRKKTKKVQKFSVDKEATEMRFKEGVIKNKGVIKKCLEKKDYNKLINMVKKDIEIENKWWAKIIYDYIIAFKKNKRIRSLIIKSLVPIWFGRVYTFIEETQNIETNKTEPLIKKQAKEFFKKRGYLLDRLRR